MLLLHGVQIDALELPNHWMTDCFRAHAYVEVQANNAALQKYEGLSALFPHSTYIQSQVARALYNLRQFDSAQKLLNGCTAIDPYRLEDVDILSNILYVNGDRAALSTLAHDVLKLDKYRPETCCVIGNYYSLRGEHEKSIAYFRRSLRLNRTYISAWILMGHEYVELRNTSAAIECYRRAVDLNPREFRAWYGLGQTYELMLLPLYASYYFKQAVTLRPYDSRMWCALGSVYEQLARVPDAFSCYVRSSMYKDNDGLALLKLAKLCRQTNRLTMASRTYYDYLCTVEGSINSANRSEVAQALLFLATQSVAAGEFQAAAAYSARILSFESGPEVAEARSLLAEITRKMNTLGMSSQAAAIASSLADMMKSPLPQPPFLSPADLEGDLGEQLAPGSAIAGSRSAGVGLSGGIATSPSLPFNASGIAIDFSP